MTVFTKVSSRLTFGEETTYGTAATTKNKWFGAQRGEWESPSPDSEVQAYYAPGSHDPVTQKPKNATLQGNLDLIVQGAWPFYWYFGSNTTTGAGPYTHTITGGTTRIGATVHEVLGDGSTETAIDWLGCQADSMTFGCEENGELYQTIGYKALDYTSGATAASTTVITTDPYTWDTATWAFYNPGTTTALTDLTTPEALTSWEYSGQHNIREIRGHRSTDAELPVTMVKGQRTHELTVSIVPANDLTLFNELTRDRTKFDFVWKSTRAANDTIEFTFKDCYAKRTPHNIPQEDTEIPVEITIQPESVQIVKVDSNATLLAAH